MHEDDIEIIPGPEVPARTPHAAEELSPPRAGIPDAAEAIRRAALSVRSAMEGVAEAGRFLRQVASFFADNAAECDRLGGQADGIVARLARWLHSAGNPDKRPRSDR